MLQVQKIKQFLAMHLLKQSTAYLVCHVYECM